MPFDAGQLYWPPLRVLFDRLEAVKLEPASADAKALQSTLHEYQPWLIKGVLGFKRPNAASKQAIQGETHLAIGPQKLPVEAFLKEATFAASSVLDLDEVQTYILLRRWYRQTAAALPSGGSTARDGSSILVHGRLSGDQLKSLALSYSQERLCLLQSLEDLLWLGEGVMGDGPFVEAVESTLSALLEASPGMEESSYRALAANLGSDDATTAAGSSSAGLGPAGGWPACGIDVQGTRAAERNILLTILALIYFHPRQQCAPQRFLDLAALFHTTLFTAAPPPVPSAAEAAGGAAPSPAQLSIKLASLLLLEVLMLDIDKPLEALAQGSTLDGEVSAFLAPNVLSSVNAELRSWWAKATPAHSPVLLSWAAMLSLAGRAEAGGHALRAHQGDALGTLCALSSSRGLQPAAADMAGTIVLSTMSAVLSAFGLDPGTLALPQTEQVVAVVVNVFTDQPRLCESFWLDPDSVLHLPIYHFMQGLGALFPALPTPLLHILTALTAGPDAAAASNSYLAQLPALTCLHQLPDPAITEDANGAGTAVTDQELPLPGSTALTLPAGAVGEVLPCPDGAAAVAWTCPPEVDPACLQLVRWRVPLAEGTAHWVQLCRAFEALSIARSAAAAPATAAAALAELQAALGFFAAVCRSDPATGADLLHVEVPAGDAAFGGYDGVGGAGAVRGPDLLRLATQGAAALVELDPLPDSAVDALASCMAICTSLAATMPGRVLEEVLQALGVSPLELSMASAPASLTSAVDIPLLRRLLAAEAARGAYAATHALLHLVLVLLQAGAPSPATSVLLSFVLQRIMPELPQWRFTARHQRWRLTTTCLHIVRQALLAAPPGAAGAAGEAGGEAAGTLGAAVSAVLKYDAAMAGCLLSLLPPDAATLEAMCRDWRLAAEVQAAEESCVGWLRLLPVLLPPASPAAMLAPTSFLRNPPTGGGARCPAAVLLSYLCYPSFDSRERALVVRALHCLSTAAAASAPDAALVALLPQDQAAAGGVAPAARAAVVHALTPGAVAACRDGFGAACDLLAGAVQYHPSLVEALMFPCALEAQGNGKENTDGNAAADGSGKKQQEGASKAATTAPGSCLDALLTLVQDSERLLQEQPFLLAKALQVLAALWQCSSGAFRPLTLLQQQPALWESLAGVVKAAAGAGPVNLPDPADSEAWGGQEAVVWRITAEAAALQVLAAEASMWGASAGSATAAMPPALASFLKVDAAVHCPALLQRYCSVLPSGGVLAELHVHAAAAGAQLLGAAMSDEVLWLSMGAGSSLAAALAAASGPLLQRHPTRAEASRGLLALADRLAPTEAAAAPVAMLGDAAALGAVVLSQAEAPARVAADRDLGAGFIFDGPLLKRRVGSVLAAQSPALAALCTRLAAASVVASMEDSRLQAATALRALHSVGHHSAWFTSSGKSAVSQEALQSGVDTLAAAAHAVVHEARAQTAEAAFSGGVAAAAGAVDVHTLHVAAVAEGARVVLLQLQQWGGGGKRAQASVPLCAQLLELAAAWLGAADVVQEPAEAVQATSHCLLSAALQLLSSVPPQGPAPASADEERLVTAAQQLLPALLSLLQPHGQHAVAAAALCSALVERLLPPSTWLRLLESHIHLGSTLEALLHAMAGQHEGQAGTAGTAGTAAVVAPDPTTPWEGSSAVEGVLLLVLQMAQTQAGAALVVEQGVLPLLLALAKWLQAPLSAGSLPGTAVIGGSLPLPPAAPQVDYSNAYRPDGSPNPAHRLWCTTLAVTGLLLAALPGNPAVEEAALQLAVGMEPRLALAVDPPEASLHQPLTLAMAQESQYALFLLCGLTRLTGRWRMALPHALPSFRRATASLLAFLGQPEGGLHCPPVSTAERAAAKVEADAGVTLAEGWFGACAGKGAATAGVAPAGSHAWQLGERLHSCMQYALSFQLATAPEVSEAEAGSLGPEWVAADTLRQVQQRCLDVANAGCARASDAKHPAMQRVLRSVAASLRATVQLQQLLSLVMQDAGVGREAQAALQRIEAALSGKASQQ